MINRIPDRRQTSRADSSPRRKHERYILESELSAFATTPSSQQKYSINILDLSLSGAYFLFSGKTPPRTGDDLIISIPWLESDIMHNIKATVMYINTSSLLGEELHGIGVHFFNTLPKNLILKTSSSKILIGTHELSIAPSKQ